MWSEVYHTFLWERDQYTDGKSHNLQIVDNLVRQYTW